MARGAATARGAAPAFAPAALLAAGWIALAPAEGGFFDHSWYPAAVGMSLLLGIVAFARGRLLPSGRWARVALLLFAAWVAFNYLSMLWSGYEGYSLENANKLLLYLATAWTLSLIPWSAGSATAFLALWTLGITVVCAVSLGSALGADELSKYMLEWRYDHPVGYSNGTAALAVMAFWPALMLACRRSLPALVQGLALAAAVFLLEFSLLPQSRAAVIGCAASGVLLLALAPERMRLLSRLLIVGIAVAFAANAIFDVYAAGESGRRVVPVLDEAGRRIILTVALAGLAGMALAFADRRVSLGEAVHARLRRGGWAVLVGLAVVALALAAVSTGRIADSVSDEWKSFEAGEPTTKQGETSRLRTLAYNRERADYYRVAWDLFKQAPIVGVGGGSFDPRYTADRHEPKHSRYAHSIWLRAISETGIVGLLLLLAAIGAVYAGALVRVRALQPDTRWTVAVCLAVGAYFVVHASFDWVDEIPALALPGFGLPFVALALVRRGSDEPARGRRISQLPTVALVVFSMVVLVPPWLAVRYTERALGRPAADAAESYRDLDRAKSLNPFSQAPASAEGTLSVRLGRTAAARRAFHESLERERTWYPYFELALLDAQEGHFGAARRDIERAASLSGSDELIAGIRRKIKKGLRLEASGVNASIERRIRADFTMRQR
ncbi:MAG TPA: O-antigen ligase family protein [Thermoleophilaceae bacterium]|nr:O-antigen ligase family protein [Thermoleophilaceae bacterium]